MGHHEHDDEELQDIISSSHSWNELLTKLNMKTLTRSLQRRIKSSNINHEHISNYFDGLHTKFNKFTKEQIEDIIKNNTDWNDVMKCFGYRSSTHFPIIKKKLNKLNINYEHLPKDIVFSWKRYTLDEILVEDSHYVSMSSLLKRLKKERNWEHKCSICNLTTWNEKPIPLEIDHIDGCHTNNTYENLRTICPNCHAQTDTYKGKNMAVCKNNTNKKLLIQSKEPKPPIPESKNCSDCKTISKEPIPEPKNCSDCKTISKPPTPEPKKCSDCKTISKPPTPEPKKCIVCSNTIDPRYMRCNACRAKSIFESGQFRKVERPSYEQLQEDVKQMSMVQVGKKYGVSDNTIRKWLKKYQKYTTQS